MPYRIDLAYPAARQSHRLATRMVHSSLTTAEATTYSLTILSSSLQTYVTVFGLREPGAPLPPAGPPPAAAAAAAASSTNSIDGGVAASAPVAAAAAAGVDAAAVAADAVSKLQSGGSGATTAASTPKKQPSASSSSSGYMSDGSGTVYHTSRPKKAKKPQ